MRDTGLSACAKAVEHCEMAHYGTLDAWAGALNMNNATLLLREPLAEQKDTQLLLTGLATRTFEDE